MGHEDQPIYDEHSALFEQPTKGSIQDTDGPQVDVEYIDPGNKGTLGFVGAIFNVNSSILGGGILSFPYAFAAAGIAGGIFATFSIVVFAYISIVIILYTYDQYCRGKADSYQSVVKVLYGRNAEMVVIISIAIYGFGSCIAYLVIISDQFVAVVTAFVSDDGWYNSRFFILPLATLVIVLPLSLLKDVSLLKYSSFLATAMVYYFTLMILYFSLVGTVDENGVPTPALIGDASEIKTQINWWEWSLQYFQCAPIICFAFICHLATVPIFRAMKNQSPAVASKVNLISLTNCTGLYLVAGIFGYLTFFCSTQSDVLLNYDDTNWAVIICRLGMGGVACCAYPIMNFVARLAINDAIIWFADKMHKKVVPEKIQHANIRFYSVSLLYTFFALLMALFVPTINAVISLLGSIFAVLFIFVFPGMFLFRLAKEPKYKKWATFFRIFGVCFMIVGIIIGGVSLAISIYNDIGMIQEYIQNGKGNVAPPSACANE